MNRYEPLSVNRRNTPPRSACSTPHGKLHVRPLAHSAVQTCRPCVGRPSLGAMGVHQPRSNPCLDQLSVGELPSVALELDRHRLVCRNRIDHPALPVVRPRARSGRITIAPVPHRAMHAMRVLVAVLSTAQASSSFRPRARRPLGCAWRSARMRASRSAAGSSFGSWGTSRPSKARFRMDWRRASAC